MAKTKKRTTKNKTTKKKVSKRKSAKVKVKKKTAKTKTMVKKGKKEKVVKRKEVIKKTAKKQPKKQLETAETIRRSREFKEIEQMLLKQRAELLRLISKSSTFEKDISKLERGDLQDMAASSLEREMTFTMGSREREEFRMINSALKKITSKTYGECEGCGENINIKRLKIVPFAQYCMECKSSMEQEILPDSGDIFN